jgi:peptidoglycan/LPS O-acetylase OafA/YrhL
MRNENIRLARRDDIDGLRAISIVAVLLFHGFPGLFPGGFIGVDVFFVISGYLISKIIVGSHESGHFSVLGFYANRIGRLFPVLFLVLAATAATGLALQSPTELGALGSHVAASAGFVQNLNLLRESGYFDAIAELKPLLHIWSLSVEEQFYIVFPFVIGAALRLRWNVFAVLAVLALASFAANLNQIAGTHPLKAFFFPHTRAWELLGGALLAQVPRTVLDRWPRGRLGDLLSLIGLGLILIPVALFTRSSVLYPGAWALLPVIGSILLLGSHGTALVNRRILARPVMVGLGLVSYPLYLWHWPLLSFARLQGGEDVTPSVRLGLSGLALALAVASYLWIERPLRRLSLGRRAVVLLILMGGMAGVGLWVRSHDWLERYPPLVQDALRLKVDVGGDWRQHRCFLNPEDEAPTRYAPECDGKGHHPLVLVWGDSYAAALYAGVSAFAGRAGVDVAQFTASACPPVLPDEGAPKCAAFYRGILDNIRRLKPEMVVLHAHWRAVPPALDATVAALRALGLSSILLVGPLPNWGGRGLPGNVFALYGETNTLMPEYSAYHLSPGIGALDVEMAKAAERLAIGYLSAWNVLCNERGCLTRAGGTLTAMDYGHLTRAGAVELIGRAEGTLTEGLLRR